MMIDYGCRLLGRSQGGPDAAWYQPYAGGAGSMHDMEKSKAAYSQFFIVWKDADPISPS